MARAEDCEVRKPMLAMETMSGLAQSYAAEFPDLAIDIDIGSLAAHLALAEAATIMARQVQARIKALGFDLTRPRYTILRMLYLAEEKSLAQSQIAQSMGVSGPYVTQMIDSLEEDGWVERFVQRPNRRITSIRLTPAGAERCAQLMPAILEYMVDSMSSLTPTERRQLTNIGRKLRAHLSPS